MGKMLLNLLVYTFFTCLKIIGIHFLKNKILLLSSVQYLAQKMLIVFETFAKFV